jgi:hypothetical protein
MTTMAVVFDLLLMVEVCMTRSDGSATSAGRKARQFSPYQKFFFKLGLVVAALFLVVLGAYLLQGNTDDTTLYNEGYIVGGQKFNAGDVEGQCMSSVWAINDSRASRSAKVAVN